MVEAPGDGGLRLFIGMLHARQQDLPRALPHLRAAASLIPGDPLPRLELARTLAALGHVDEAETALRGIDPRGPAGGALIRVQGAIRQRRGEHREAATLFRAITAREPRDFESWASLGISLLALGDAAGAIDGLQRALALKPGQTGVRMRLAEAQVAAGRGAEGLAFARAIAAETPRDPLAQVTVARLEDLLGAPDRAEAALAAALECDAACIPAMLALADLAERANRIDELAALIARLDAAGVPQTDTALLRARLRCRQGDHTAALALAQSSPVSLDTGRRAQIIGECSDRLGDAATAFDAFAEMNRVTAAEVADARGAAAEYRAMIVRRTTTLTAVPSPAEIHDGREDPVFLFGFPRSGTTLLDTFLMGHPTALVLEERPALFNACEGLGDGALTAAQIASARARYFAEIDALAPDAANRLVIDKLPLGMIETAIVHRLFPRARFIFVERHPCDVVLSCFMTRFDPRGGMANFLDLGDAARLYDAALAHWTRCRALLPLAVHTLRYESMIADAAAALGPLSGFLGLTLSAEMLDHCRTAKARAHIATPSYAQVAEPLYTRALARWERYRPQLAPVLPLLAPWAQRMGYSCDEHHLNTTNIPEIRAA